MSRKPQIIRVVTLALVLAALVSLVIAFGVGAQETDEPVVTMSNIGRFVDGSEVEGAYSRLIRYNNGVTMTLSTSDLIPSDVYSIWWVIFNEPQNCSDGACDLDDLFLVEDGQIVLDEVGNRALNWEGIEASNISVQHAAGSYNDEGTINVSASLGLGSVPGIVFGPGLLDAQKAEVHLVVRTHGQFQEGAFDDQISTFGGGCDPIDTAPCDDVQFAMHLPVVP
jgi:hypothetical protein